MYLQLMLLFFASTAFAEDLTLQQCQQDLQRAQELVVRQEYEAGQCLQQLGQMKVDAAQTHAQQLHAPPSPPAPPVEAPRAETH